MSKQELKPPPKIESPFRKLRLCNNQWAEPKFIEFLRTYGTEIKTLSIQTSGIWNIEKFSNFIYSVLGNWCPYLKELRLDVSFDFIDRTCDDFQQEEPFVLKNTLKLQRIQLEIKKDSQEVFTRFWKLIRPLVSLIASAVLNSPSLITIQSNVNEFYRTIAVEKVDLYKLRNLWIQIKEAPKEDRNLHFLAGLKVFTLRKLILEGDFHSEGPFFTLLSKSSQTLTTLSIHFNSDSKIQEDEEESPFFQIISLLPYLESFTFVKTGKLLRDIDDYFKSSREISLLEAADDEVHLNLKSLVIKNLSEGGSMNDIKSLEVLAKRLPMLKYLEVDINHKPLPLMANGWDIDEYNNHFLAPNIQTKDAFEIFSTMTCLTKAILRRGNSAEEISEEDIIHFDYSKVEEFLKDVKRKAAESAHERDANETETSKMKRLGDRYEDDNDVPSLIHGDSSS